MLALARNVFDKLDDWALAAWGNPIVRRVAILLGVTVVADFLHWQSQSGFVTYLQHLVGVAWPVIEPALRVLG